MGTKTKRIVFADFDEFLKLSLAVLGCEKFNKCNNVRYLNNTCAGVNIAICKTEDVKITFVTAEHENLRHNIDNHNVMETYEMIRSMPKHSGVMFYEYISSE